MLFAHRLAFCQFHMQDVFIANCRLELLLRGEYSRLGTCTRIRLDGRIPNASCTACRSSVEQINAIHETNTEHKQKQTQSAAEIGNGAAKGAGRKRKGAVAA